MKYPYCTRFSVLGPEFYVRRETNNLEWLIITAATLNLSYQTRRKNFNEHNVNRFLLCNGIIYAPITIRKALNSLCLEGICIRVTCPWDRRIRSYHFKESLELHNIFKNSFMF